MDTTTTGQVRPSHYNSTKYSTFDLVNDWELGFFSGNVAKYIQRHNRKGTPIQDLEKALTYFDEWVKRLTNHSSSPHVFVLKIGIFSLVIDWELTEATAHIMKCIQLNSIGELHSSWVCACAREGLVAEIERLKSEVGA